ncbi:hypothetical protein REPUB_Repub02eG0260700 [Reevesia pubescens]
MSNSGLFFVKTEEEGMEFGIMERPTLEFQSTASSSNEPDDHEEKKEEESNVKESEKIKKISLGELKATGDDDDGFKTPTSLEHKIPVIKECPPAPKIQKSHSSNRRKVSPRISRNLQLDFSKEVESLFPEPLLADLHRKVKKARTQENNGVSVSRIQPDFFLSMSNSGFFLVKDEEERVEFDILKRRLALEFQEECQATATSSAHGIPDDDQEREESNVTAPKESEEKKKIGLGELKATDDDDEGFKTPTSLDHKIPVIKECPPAPRKPKSNQRTASPSCSSRIRRNLQLDFSQELDSLFPEPFLADLHRKVVKKA